MKNSKIYAAAAVFLFIAIIAASVYYFAGSEADVTGNAISLKSLFKKQITDSRVRIPPERPIYSFNRSGVFASANIGTEAFTLSNFSLDIFKKPNMDYRAVVKWKINAPPARTIFGSYIILYANKTNRLTGDRFLMQAGVNYTLEPISNIELTYDFLEEGTEHLILIETSVEGGVLEYNASFKTPPIEPARVVCNKIIDNRPTADKFNIFFAPLRYTAEEISAGRFEADVRDVLYNAEPVVYNADTETYSPVVNKRRSLLEIPVFNKSRSAFNVFIINASLSAPVAYNKLVSIGKACSFNRERDIFIIMANEERGMAYAQGVGTGIWVDLSRGSDRFRGTGAILAHEIAHLIGFDEEYYGWADWGDPRPEFVQAPNCEYGNLTCEKFCSGTNAELVGAIHSAKHKAMQCRDMVRSGNVDAWQTFCPTLNLEEYIAAIVRTSGTLSGASNLAEFCALPLSTSRIYACYAGTLMPLEDENIGTGCREGYGCYLGCGTHYEYTKGSYVSIMGGGSMGEDNRIYRDLDAASSTPIMPDFSKADSDILERYFSQFTTRYTLARSPIGRVPTRRIPPR